MPVSVLRGRVVADGEPLWLKSDRQWALALMLEEKATHSCGHPVDEAFAMESHSAYETDRLICNACADLQMTQEAFLESNPEGGSKGTVFVVKRKEQTE